MDLISSKLETLEWFSFRGPDTESDFNGLEKDNPEIPDPKNEYGLFSSLKYICINVTINDEYDVEHRQAVIDNFKKYLVVKSPKLINPIHISFHYPLRVIFESRLVH